MNERKTVANNVLPPIPARNFDWCAYYDGEEETGVVGWGRTEEEAIKNLKETEEWLQDK